MSVTVELQLCSNGPQLPTQQQVQLWSQVALPNLCDNVELVVRIADAEECRQTNSKFRGIDRATNVLSFPNELPTLLARELDPRPLGDLLLCAPVVLDEARTQGKSAAAHFAHMVIHGVLHLTGHDHQDDAQAERMETLEIEILKALGYSNPYQPA